MRGLGLISVLATTNLAVAQDLDEWARRCLNNGDQAYGSVVCQGFRAGVAYQQRPLPQQIIIPGNLPDPGGGSPLATNEQFEQYLRNQSGILSDYADIISRSAEMPPMSAGAGPGGQTDALPPVQTPPDPNMLRYDDPTGKPMVDF